MVESKFEKDYSNKKTIDGSVCGEGEVLIPYRVDKDMLEHEGVIKENLETWSFCGKKILVGFVPVKEANAEMMMKMFWRDLNDYLEKYRKKRCYIPNGKGGFKRCPKENVCENCKEYGNMDSKLFRTLYSSLDQMMEGLDGDDSEEGGFDITGTTEEMDKAAVLDTLNFILDELRVMDERYPQIFSMHYEGYQKNEILNAVDLGVGQSQGYEIIKKVIKAVQKIYNDNF